MQEQNTSSLHSRYGFQQIEYHGPDTRSVVVHSAAVNMATGTAARYISDTTGAASIAAQVLALGIRCWQWPGHCGPGGLPHVLLLWRGEEHVQQFLCSVLQITSLSQSIAIMPYHDISYSPILEQRL